MNKRLTVSRARPLTTVDLDVLGALLAQSSLYMSFVVTQGFGSTNCQVISNSRVDDNVE